MQLGERAIAFRTAVRHRWRADARLARRVAGMAGLAVFAGGFLVAIGYGRIVLSVLVAAVIVFVIVAFAAAPPKLHIAAPVRTATGNAAAMPRAARSLSVRTGRSVRALARSALALFARTGKSLRVAAMQAASRTRRSDLRRHALQLNAAGAQYRRDGRYDDAVDCHRRALDMFAALDDRKAVALTQSNLALALSHAGDDKWAIGLFEEAAATLHELGDEQHEAQIIANLGLAHRRHGRREEGDNVLELALSKLPRASSEYRAIEAELRRAS